MTTKIFLLVLIIGAAPNSAKAQDPEFQQKSLELILNAADRICNIVSVNGKATSSEISGKINVELNGLLSKFVDAGVSAGGTKTDSQYANVLQADLAATLKDNAQCKLKVFEDLKDKFFPNSSPATIEPVTPAHQPAYIGLEYNDLDPDQARRLGLGTSQGGAVVTGVEEGGAAQLAGIEVNDVILKVGGQEIRDPIDLKRFLKKAKPGTKVNLEIWRDRERQMAEMLVSQSP